MRFHGLMLVRDEADVLPQCLDALLPTIDALYVYDLGSRDGTWEIIQDYAVHDKRVVPYSHERTLYSDALRCVLFDRFRDRFKTGDWIMKVDADEFHLLPPAVFVRERLLKEESMVYLQWYFFRLTTAEVAAYEAGKPTIMEDRRRPIWERRRYYKVSHYSEPRMFRYRTTMQWPEWSNWPFNAGLVAKERIPILHFPHRDPIQMQARFRLRAGMMARKAIAGSHWEQSDWSEDLVDALSGMTVNLSRDGGKRGLASDREVDSGPLYHRRLDAPVEEVRLYNHLQRLPKRMLQRFAHALFVPWLDMHRPTFDPRYQPLTTDL